MNDTPKAQPSSWVRILLIVSLAVNFVLVGLAIGAVVSVSKAPSSDGVGRLVGPLLADMPPELRGQMRQEVRRYRTELLDLRQDVKDADIAVRAAVTAVPFDPNALEGALIRRAAAIEAALTGLNQPILAVVSLLTPEERELLGQTMDSRQKRLFRQGGPGGLFKPGRQNQNEQTE